MNGPGPKVEMLALVILLSIRCVYGDVNPGLLEKPTLSKVQAKKRETANPNPLQSTYHLYSIVFRDFLSSALHNCSSHSRQHLLTLRKISKNGKFRDILWDAGFCLLLQHRSVECSILKVPTPF